MMLNQMGANIPYPYHSLPMVSTPDRLGYYALLGILELMLAKTPPTPPSGKKGHTMSLTIDGGRPPKK